MNDNDGGFPNIHVCLPDGNVNSKKLSMGKKDFFGEDSSSDLGMDWTWLFEPLPPMMAWLYSTWQAWSLSRWDFSQISPNSETQDYQTETYQF